MQILIKKLARESLCSCGYPAMNSEVVLGKEYRIPRMNAVGEKDVWVCGGCAKETPIQVIMVLQDDGSIGWMPKELFDWDEATSTAPS